MKKTKGGFYISQVKQLSDRVFQRLLKEDGINDFNGPQGRILYVLWQEDNLPIIEISKRTSLAKTTLTSMLDRMEMAGHIKRNFDTNNRRQILITLTPETRALKNKYEIVSNEMSELFYKDFSDEEITDFEKYLYRIIKNLKEIEE
ncbi:MarR family transcriptional regulator [Clostridium oryzae]|uniref:Organic hydroperoxide resistance transcriptional regulator n=1 Tax=Clostridium oryzae TaxID=1450648 RepID=A0A1V4I6C0_9CLOT|nr:MarR family transcriptional regulator [Clostridium oryzae]OPJ55107.1 organic hydroperoxide resistance transcriptional regulator [Clostridium oryzae]